MDVIVYVLCGIACLIQSWGKNTVEEPSIMVIVRIVNSIAIFVWSVFTPSPIEEIVGGAVNFRPAAYLCFISELVYFPEALTQMVGVTPCIPNPSRLLRNSEVEVDVEGFAEKLYVLLFQCPSCRPR